MYAQIGRLVAISIYTLIIVASLVLACINLVATAIKTGAWPDVVWTHALVLFTPLLIFVMLGALAAALIGSEVGVRIGAHVNVALEEAELKRIGKCLDATREALADRKW